LRTLHRWHGCRCGWHQHEHGERGDEAHAPSVARPPVRGHQRARFCNYSTLATWSSVIIAFDQRPAPTTRLCHQQYGATCGLPCVGDQEIECLHPRFADPRQVRDCSVPARSSNPRKGAVVGDVLKSRDNGLVGGSNPPGHVSWSLTNSPQFAGVSAVQIPRMRSLPRMKTAQRWFGAFRLWRPKSVSRCAEKAAARDSVRMRQRPVCIQEIGEELDWDMVGRLPPG
jgi:hypothetical protein